MFVRSLSTLLLSALSIALFASGAHASLQSPKHHLARSPAPKPDLTTLSSKSMRKRTLTGQTIAFACYGGGGDCECPDDLTGASGVLIHVYPGYQCAYPGGACTWSDKTGALLNTAQTNCPTYAPCSTTGGCSCSQDNNGDTGVLINQFTGYQCAYEGGACTWDDDGNLQNVQQTNCPVYAKCTQSGQDS